ncbi:MAG: insulinase family protein, partial [Thermoanaerobaculia bacterium]|nr:insulinase family protein [Thermoanaerobaculia bacterium]
MTPSSNARCLTLITLALLMLGGPALAGEIPGLSSKTLDNGLEVIVIENPAVPLVTVEIAVHAGGFVEPPELDGLSHLYEHMFFKGNAEIPTQEGFLERMRELGAVWNGTTSEELVNYYFTLPSSRLREGTDFMRAALLQPLFRRDELVRERPVVLSEFDRNEANPNFHLFREVNRALWGENFSRKNVIGDRTVLATATREQMLLFREHYYIPNNSALIFSGDVDPSDAFELAEEFFGDWKRAEDPFLKFPVPSNPPLTESSTLAVIQPVQRVTLNVAWHGPGMKADPPSTYAADVLSYILSQPDSGWNRRLVESGLFDFTNLSYLSQVHTGPITLIAVTSADRLDRAYSALQSELTALTSPDYFSNEELAYAKNQLEYSELRGRQQPSEFIHTVSFWWATGGLDYYRNYIDDLRAVTREDIGRFVRRYVEDKPHVTAVLISEEELDQVVLLRDAEVVRPESGTSGTAIAAQKKEGAATEEFEIAGVPVLLRQLPSAPTVAVAAFVRGGLNDTASSDAGLENLVWSVAAKQSAAYDKETMARELTRLGAQLGHQIQSNSTSFSLDAIADNAAESLTIFLDALTHPSFTEEELGLVRERQLSNLAANEADPDEHLSQLASRAHFGDHPSGLDPLGNETTVPSFDVGDLERKHTAILQRSRLFFSVAGNIDRPTLERL